MHELALLAEYQIRLIADVVTGKLEVCEAATRLPGESEEAGWQGASDAERDTDEPVDDLDAERFEAAV